jgi:hypothetical protein
VPTKTNPARIPSPKIEYVVLEKSDLTLALRWLHTAKSNRHSAHMAIESCLTICRSSYRSRADAALGAQLRVELERMRKPAHSLLEQLAVLWNQAADLGIKPTLTPEAEHELQSRIDLESFVAHLRSMNDALDSAIQSCLAKPKGDGSSRTHLKGVLRKDVCNAIEGLFARTYEGPTSQRRVNSAEFRKWALEKIVNS